MNVKRLTVSPETVRMLELGHPWVVADAATRRWPQGLRCGELVLLCSPEGRELAAALVDPRDRVVARVVSRRLPVVLDRAWFEQRLAAALRLRTDQLDLEQSNAWRLVNGEGDGLPGLTVDCYGDYLLLQCYSPVWEAWLQPLQQALVRLLQPAGIYLKSRPRQTRKLEAKGGQPDNRLLYGTALETKLSVRENDLSFLVDLRQGLHTGLFLDQRENRAELMRRSRGQRLLNLFCFTGAFSVAAVAAGARETVSVDASATYLAWAKENFACNRLNPKRHRFIEGDCLQAVKRLREAGERFDLILMDPPSFSTTRQGRFTTRGGTSDLVAAVLPLLEPSGLLICSSNHQKVDIADYLKELRRGALQAGCELQVLGVRGQPGDFPFTVGFPEGRYLKYVIATIARD